MKTSFSGEDFARTLTEGSLKEPIIGMVKRSEDPKVIQFSLGTLYQSWVSIPVEAIDTVEWLGKVSYRDSAYDYVQLFLKDNVGPLAEALAALLRGHIGALARPPRSLPVSLVTGGCPPPSVNGLDLSELGGCSIDIDGAPFLRGHGSVADCCHNCETFQRAYPGSLVCCQFFPERPVNCG